MENATKALLIGAGVLVGVLIFAIFIYEMTYIASVSDDVNANARHKEILQFNAQFEGYANRTITNGYLNKENAIAIQEFATMCNLVNDWNKANPSDLITIEVVGSDPSVSTIRNYLERINKASTTNNMMLEDLFEELSTKLYFFEFKSNGGIEYNNEGGRISRLIFKVNVN